MKSKYTITLILSILLFINSTTSAQSYIPTIIKGRAWEITQPLGKGQSVTYSIRLACDTVINSLNYTKVISSNTTNSFFVREDIMSHKIYKYDNVLGADKLIVDYDITVGSTFNGVRVDSINYATYFGQLRKTIYFNNLVKWIEGVGNSFIGVSDVYNGYTYVTNVFNSGTNCLALSASEIELNHLEVKQIGSDIYFYSSLNTPIILNIYNFTGQLLNQSTINNTLTLDLSTYSNQLILLEMTSGRKRRVMKVLTY